MESSPLFFGLEFQPLSNLNIKPSASYVHPALDQLPEQRNSSAERGLQSFSIDGTASGWLTATQPPRASSRRLMDATKSALCWYPQWTHLKSAWLSPIEFVYCTTPGASLRGKVRFCQDHRNSPISALIGDHLLEPSYGQRLK